MMKAAVFEDINEIHIRSVPVPEVKPGFALVKIKAAGLCVTDVHVMRGTFQHSTPPCILGHEAAGDVVSFGELDWPTSLKVGSRVVIETMIACGTCEYCLSGFKNLCQHGQDIGEIKYQGCYSEYIAVPVGNLYEIPDCMSYEEAAIFESFVCPVGGLHRLDVKLADKVLIQGLGPAGLAFLQSAKALGAKKVIVSDTKDYKLQLAAKYGADLCINPQCDDLTQKVMEMTDGQGVDISIEASGAEQAITNSLNLCKKNGKVIFYGIPADQHNTRFDVTQVITKQLNLYGTSGAPGSWRRTLDLYEEGVFNIKDMVTHKFSLEQINQAIEVLEDPGAEIIKAVLIP